MSDKKERLSLDVIGTLEDAVEQNSLDFKKWGQLIEQVVAKDKEEQVRATFDKYFTIFRFDARQWNNYVNFELNRGEFNNVEQIFAKCLPITNDVDLCRTYVSYVRRVNDVITGGEKARTTVLSAFDFAINKVGIDVDSAELWKDYLDFFKSWTPSSSWEQQQKTDLIRRLYRRCLVIPAAKIESTWAEYTKWENDVSTPNSASKFIADLSTSYMEARSWNTEYKNATKGSLRRRTIPMSLQEDTNNVLTTQIEVWFRWIALEKKNHLNLRDHELRQRVEYVYKQATYTLPFVPEVWFRFNRFLLSENEEANRPRCIDVLTEGAKLNPGSFLIAFQLSELLEKDNSFERASETLRTLINHLSKDYDKLKEELDALNAKVKESATNGNEAPKDSKGDDSDDDMIDNNSSEIKLSESEALAILGLEAKLEESSRSVTLAYINLMALSKRTQGIKEVRAVFKQRKNYKALGYELFVENALTEYYSDNKKIADKVFDLAMKTYSQDGAFLYAYLDYLILTNSVESIKVFFEMAVTNLQQQISEDQESIQLTRGNILDQKKRTVRLKKSQSAMKRIIKRYIRFAYSYLDLDTVLALEKRYLQLFPDDDELSLFIDRYRGSAVDAIAKYDLCTEAKSDSEDEDEEEEPVRKSRKSKKRQKLSSPSDNYSPESTSGSTANNSIVGNGQISGSQVTQQENQYGFVGNTIYSLLQVLPNAGYFGPPGEHIFNSSKLVELFNNLPDLPSDS
ncbi:hypothetical protein FT663_01821 [Candidozyma haemuli var. vulneris]|uniref:mRNA 3'-end-processing protein RNA14 n=1 Tax=Candidozyma haemuli TaxID=45357 RepID=A0A2V1B0C2_9ASCO|nr:hypothetical protein CXQ85_002840 [[Candida] haemuloni]KAF3991057.1 hypothetical protein FT662_01885 [[Candida] haemuloni var. vulneris]KAF3993653.1 hypothetical protein FT663_01821 [[Candida] haemuloni var. vulneris]PVH23113.1 hypothetical protein CXQ85_002840 [[Candida] haemuloni]